MVDILFVFWFGGCIDCTELLLQIIDLLFCEHNLLWLVCIQFGLECECQCKFGIGFGLECECDCDVFDVTYRY